MARLIPPIPDEELSAFLDGEVSGARAAQIAAAIKNDPRLSRRLQSYAMLTRMLIDFRQDVLDEPIPPRLLKVLDDEGLDDE